MKKQKKVFEGMYFDDNQFANTDFIREKYTIDIDKEIVNTYFEENEVNGVKRYFLPDVLLYYVLTDIECFIVSWDKTDDRARLYIENDKVVEFTVNGWRNVLKEYCVYLDEDLKHIYGRRDILEKVQYLLANNLMPMI